ncbi:flagellar export protein FliJ [Glaciecola siphonariae]|uniref:Flagellar FliJ protein n=1 Tax=Glaciecola siphonariae TaxID=521012 RepID=A0ABV9LW89_9ALTE
MASIKQLTLVANLEKDKEQALAKQYQQAKQHLFDNQQKLSSLEQYRLDYMNLIKKKASEGLAAKALIQHQSFVGKLDRACEQQINVINQATLVSQQRKTQWLAQQTKAQAIVKLIEKQSRIQNTLAAKQEQKMFDELASMSLLKRAKSTI